MLTGSESAKHSRKPEIMADAAYAVLCRDSKSATGQFLIDDEVLKAEGLTDAQIAQYACDPSNLDNLMPDFFLDAAIDAVNAGKVEGAKPQAAKPDTNSVEGIFAAISSRLNPDLVKNTGAVFQFKLTGADEGTWFIDLKNGSGAAGKGEAPSTPDATLTMDGKNFFALFTDCAETRIGTKPGGGSDMKPGRHAVTRLGYEVRSPAEEILLKAAKTSYE
ncbi:unnamed protein product [Nesidiocoris tenuis]|uniref:SCP2 domain-containing protein n=1 Tax=Nesidiocoris tenuis TaxID=355587 RepID=A0A6H5GX52_9HEMI|nr:unnamed protein product [Nesidiocoris tenuis]